MGEKRIKGIIKKINEGTDAQELIKKWIHEKANPEEVLNILSNWETLQIFELHNFNSCQHYTCKIVRQELERKKVIPDKEIQKAMKSEKKIFVGDYAINYQVPKFK